MKLKDIADMEEYLENRCYCPHEIYDYSGFFYHLFYPDQDCLLIGSYEAHDRTFTYVIADNEYGIAQIICIVIDGDIVEDCVRFYATEHNIEQIKKQMRGEQDFVDFERNYKEMHTLEEIMKLTDLVMIS